MSEHYIRIGPNGPDDGTTDEPGDVHVHRLWGHARYGMKIGFDLPAPWEDEAATRELKERLDWDSTHRSFNSAAGDEWECDADAINELVREMTDAGYVVTVELGVARKLERQHGIRFLPEHRD